MVRIFRNRRAQTTAEYAILIAIVVGAVVAMQVYVRRGIQGRIKNVVDHNPPSATVGDQTLTFTGEQYEPYYQSSDAATSRASKQQDVLGKGGQAGRVVAEQTQQMSQRKQAWDETSDTSAVDKGSLTSAAAPALPTMSNAPAEGDK